MSDKIIEFQPTNKQFTAWQYLTNNIHSEIGYGGAAGGGKSWEGCFWQASMREAYPETRGFIGRRELKNLKRTTLRTFLKMCNCYGWINEKHFRLNQQEGIIEWHNGSEIMLMDLSYMPSDPLYLRLGGLELTDALVEESNEVDSMAIEILKSRIGRQKNIDYGLMPKLMETFNPDKGHVYRRYYKPYKENRLPDHVAFIQALPTDNPYLPASYIEQLKRADKITRERLLNGNFEYDDDPAKLMEYDAILDLFTNKAEESEEKYLSIDVARMGSDKTVIIYWVGLQVKKIWLFERQDLKITRKKIEKICDRLQIRRSHIVVDEDGVGGGLVDELDGCKGFINNSSCIQPEIASEDESKKLNYANLKTQCYFDFARLVNEGKIGIEGIDEKIKDIIVEELEQVKQKDIDKDGKIALIPKEKIKENIGRSPDIADALMMRMYLELKIETNLKPFFI